MKPQKSIQQLNEDAAARRELAQATRHQPRTARREPSTRAEFAHAREISRSAHTMRGAGYAVATNPTTHAIAITGPVPAVWDSAKGNELADECPPYVTLAEYVLAIYEQEAR